jgi:hypothetical protein
MPSESTELERAQRILSKLLDEIKNDPPHMHIPEYITSAIIATCEFIAKELPKAEARFKATDRGR